MKRKGTYRRKRSFNKKRRGSFAGKFHRKSSPKKFSQIQLSRGGIRL